MSSLSKLAIALTATLATGSAGAQSWFSFEASAGGLKYGGLDAKNGRWIQDGAKYSTSLNAPAIEAGITGSLLDRGSWGIDYHLGGFYLGRAESQCTCNPIDSDYARHRHSVPDADFVGSGEVYGAKATLEPWIAGPAGLRFGLIGGATYSRVVWNETIYNWSNARGMVPRTISNSASSTVPGGVIGASVSSGRLSLVYQHFFFAHPGNAQALFRSADTLSLRYKF